MYYSINTKYLVNKSFSFLISKTFCLNFNKFNSVPHPLINPICLLHNIFFSLISLINLVKIADSINFKNVLDIAIDLILLISPTSSAFLFKQKILLVVNSSDITPGINYLFNIILKFSYTGSKSFIFFNTFLIDFPGIKSQLVDLFLTTFYIHILYLQL